MCLLLRAQIGRFYLRSVGQFRRRALGHDASCVQHIPPVCHLEGQAGVLLHNDDRESLAVELFGFPFIKAVFIASNFVTLTKTGETDWNDVIPSVRQFLKDYLEEGKSVINEEELAAVKQTSSNEVAADDDDVVKRIKELLDNYVRPAVEMDGGAIQFRSYEDGVVNLMMQGSCSGCPSSMITLKAGIEGMMKRMIPEVKEVVAEAE